MVDDIDTLFDRIQALLAPVSDGNLDLPLIEDTLTDGYARALELEAERWRLERQIGDVATRLEDGDARKLAQEISALSKRVLATGDDLKALRGMLATLRARAAEVRAA